MAANSVECYTLVDDIDQRLHPTLIDYIIIAVYKECTPYCLSLLIEGIPHTLCPLCWEGIKCVTPTQISPLLYAGKCKVISIQETTIWIMNNQSQVQFGPALLSWEVQSTAITNQMELQQRNHPPSAAYKKATGFLQKLKWWSVILHLLKEWNSVPILIPIQ